MTIERFMLARVVAAAVVPRSAAEFLEHLSWDGDLRHLEDDVASEQTLERLRDIRPRAHGSILSDVLEDLLAKWAREGHELERA